LQERSGCDARLKVGGDRVDFGCGDGGVLGVGGGPEPADAVTGFVVVEVAGSGRHDGAFAFAAEDFGFRGGVESGTEIATKGMSISAWEVRKKIGRGDIRVDVVDANEIVLDQDLAFFWGRNWEVSPILKDLNTTSLLNEDSIHGLGD
jgi:hypothetical protein